MNKHWANDAIFYHIYPLGFCDAPYQNDFCSTPNPRLETISNCIYHFKELGVNAIYLGPVFESHIHGYDTVDYYRVDRRLGDNQTLSNLISKFHQQNIRVIFDGVFNHVGRHFWAFQDVLIKGQLSKYCDWFKGINFNQRSSYQDPFSYEGWNGFYDLVKLNLKNINVREHIFQAINTWKNEFELDGLRLDVADCLDPDFLKQLSSFCHNLDPQFWLMGEVIHGDYRNWANLEMLDSVTNYESYKGLYSSHNDKNYFEIAYTLNRQFGKNGIYQDLPLYNFADNHDVNRVASELNNSAHLYPLYCLLYTIPGIPSIYYGSEWGREGKRSIEDDRPLRPVFDLSTIPQNSPHPDLMKTLSILARIRHQSKALRHGTYQQVFVSHEQFAFIRQTIEESIIVIVNASEQPISIEIPLPINILSKFSLDQVRWIDLLNTGENFHNSNNDVKENRFEFYQGRQNYLKIVIPAQWGRILKIFE